MLYLFIHRCDSGNCSVVLAQNISECYCCKELEGCGEALESDLVQQDISPNAILNCVTEHPGFNPVCLQKWSLRMAHHGCKQIQDQGEATVQAKRK